MPAQVQVLSFGAMDVTIPASPVEVGSCVAGIPGNPSEPFSCALGTMAPDSMIEITVLVKVDPSTPHGTILTNNAMVSGEVNDPDNSDNFATALTTVEAEADLEISKTSLEPNYKPNSVVTYTIGVTNHGPSDALAVVVSDPLPLQGNQIIYLSDTGGCTKAGSILTCNLGSMPVGTSQSFNIDIQVKGNRGDITNTATVDSTTVDPNAANNSSTLIVSVK